MWHNIFDWIIIGLILLSTLEVFLSTFEGVYSKVHGLMRAIDIFTIVFFSIEVPLRIWTADLIDPKYKGFWGRIRYCFSFYGMIDLLSTYTFYVALVFPIPYQALKTLRIIRILRIFRYMKSFQLLRDAFASKKQEMSISLQFLCIITLILSFLLYFVENTAQPDVFTDGWKAVIWSFSQYIGDPGGFADYQPVTFIGRCISCVVGILGIAIFAVPAGLIGSGFIEVIEENKNTKKSKTDIDRIHHAFKWLKDTHYTGLLYVPPFKSLATILVNQNLSEADIVDAVKNSDDLHLYNLAKAYNSQDAPVDRIVVTMAYRNKPYGCLIDRHSKVTIVSTSGHDEPITTWAAFLLAKIGGFNFVSRDFSVNPDNPLSFYNIADPDGSPNLRMYLDDINALSANEDSWIIPMCFCSGPKSRESKIHLCYSTIKGDDGYENPKKSFVDVATFDALYNDFSSSFKNKYDLLCDKNDYYPLTNKTMFFHLECKNGFALRIEYYLMYFNSNNVEMIKMMAEILKRHLEPGVEIVLPKEMTELPANCFGYDNYLN
ncbi:MAG: ion transporter [Candidatus Cryptobacteroides sp.]